MILVFLALFTQTTLALDLQEEISKANSFFSKSLELPKAQISYQIKEACKRTGYSFKEKLIRFCPKDNVIEAGTQSLDVVRHETFHAFICFHYPDSCHQGIVKNKFAITIHEAVADLYTSLLDDNDLFGENFYKEQRYIRPYRESYYYSLVENEYLRAQALNELMLKEVSTDGFSDKIKTLIKELRFETFVELFNPPKAFLETEVTLRSNSHQPSTKRFWVHETLEVDFEAKEDLTIKAVWLKGNESVEVEVKKSSLRVFPKQAGRDKYLIEYYLDGVKRGAKVLWFGVRKERS